MRPLYLYLLCIFSLSQSAVITRWSDLSIQQLGFWRLLIAALIVRVVFCRRSFFQLPVNAKEVLYVFICGVALYLHFYSYFYAAKTTLVAHTLLLFSLNPLFTGLISRFVLHEVFPTRAVYSFAFGFLALVVMVAPTFFDPSHQFGLGEVAALFSAGAYALYVVLGKKIQKDGMLPGQLISSAFLVASFSFFIQMVGADLPVLFSSQRSVVSLMLLVLFPTLLGHASFLYLARRLNINWMSVGKLAEPPLAALSAFVIFGQVPTFYTYVAFAMLAVSLYFLLYDPQVRRKGES